MMDYENDRASNAGSLIGIVVAALFAVALFAGYTFFISENAPQTTATNTQQTTPAPAPNASPENAPPASQTPPQDNLPRDGESNSQNAN